MKKEKQASFPKTIMLTESTERERNEDRTKQNPCRVNPWSNRVNVKIELACVSEGIGHIGHRSTNTLVIPCALAWCKSTNISQLGCRELTM